MYSTSHGSGRLDTPQLASALCYLNGDSPNQFNEELLHHHEPQPLAFLASSQTTARPGLSRARLQSQIPPQHPRSSPCAAVFTPNDTYFQHTMDTPASHLETDISLLRSTKANLDPLRNEFQSAVLNYKTEREKFYRFAQHFQEVKDGLICIVNQLVLVGSETLHRAKNELKSLEPKLDFAFNGMEEEGNKCCTLEDRMADLLYSISKLEKRICPVPDNHLQHIHQPDFSPSRQSEATYNEPAESIPDQTPPIVQELYSRIGDYRVYLDDIHNFESELRQDLDERDSLRANGSNVSPDVDFFKERKELRDRMQRGLDQAQADITRLKEECSRSGIVLEDDLYIPDVFDRSFTLTPAHERVFDNPKPEPMSSKDSIIDDYFETRNRVTDWLTGGSIQDGTVQPVLSKDIRDAVDNDTLSEASWVDARHPGQSHPHLLSARASMIQMPEYVGPSPGSAEITTLLRKSMSESIFPAHQLRKIPSGGTRFTI